MNDHPVPTRNEWEEKRQTLLDAALILFARHEFNAVSMRDIGQAGGLHMATLYHYFDNKAALYDAVCDNAFRKLTDLVMHALSQDNNPEDKLRRFARTITKFFLEEHAEVGILERELIFMKHNARKNAHFPEFMALPLMTLSDVVVELQPTVLALVPPHRIAEILWDIAWGVTRHLPAHVAVMNRKFSRKDWDAISEEIWVVMTRLLGIEYRTIKQKRARSPRP